VALGFGPRGAAAEDRRPPRVDRGVDAADERMSDAKPPRHRRPPRLRVGRITGSPRTALERGAGDDLALVNYNINQLAAVAERARDEGKTGLEIEARDVLGRQGLRKLELTVGKKMSLNVNLKTQDDLEPTAAFLRGLSPAERAALDAVLDRYDQAQRGHVIPAKALSSGKAEQ
jgi:hypothetical protein